MEELPPPSAAGNDMDHLPVHHNPMTDSRQTMARILSSHKSDLVSSTFKEAASISCCLLSCPVRQRVEYR